MYPGNHPENDSSLDIYVHKLKAKPQRDPMATKWLDFNKRPLEFVLAAPTVVNTWSFTTANDCVERDPVSWVLEGIDGQCQRTRS